MSVSAAVQSPGYARSLAIRCNEPPEHPLAIVNLVLLTRAHRNLEVFFQDALDLGDATGRFEQLLPSSAAITSGMCSCSAIARIASLLSSDMTTHSCAVSIMANLLYNADDNRCKQQARIG